MTDTQTQTDDAGQDEPQLTGLAGVAKLLRENPETLVGGEETPGEDGAPIIAQASANASADQEHDDDDPGLSEDGLGLQPELSESGGTDAIALALQGLAEKAGITLDDLFATVVPLDAGTSTTLGELKDSFKDYSRLTEDKAAYEDNRTKFENEMIRSRAELQEVIAILQQDGAVPDIIYQRAATVFEESRAAELSKLVAIKPEWADPQVFGQAKDALMETVGEYGFKRSELEAVFDHRLTKLLHDFHTMRMRFKDANAASKRVIKQSRRQRATARTA